MRAPFEGVQASQSHFDHPLRHSNAPTCSSEDALHTDNQPRCMQQPWRMHLSIPEMHAPGAYKTGRMHLLAPKDARVQHGARANWGDTRLLLSKSSAAGGSNPRGTNGGGSILP